MEPASGFEQLLTLRRAKTNDEDKDVKKRPTRRRICNNATKKQPKAKKQPLLAFMKSARERASG